MRSVVKTKRKGGKPKGEKRMREEKEIREALKRLKDEHLRRIRDPDSYPSPRLVAMVDILEWVLGDRRMFPDFE